MSARTYANSKYPDWIASFLIAFIPSLIIYYMLAGDANAINIDERLSKKAEKAEIVEVREYVNSRFDNHETKEQLIFNSIDRSIEEIKQNNKDARSEYLIQIQLLRKDILDLYKSK